MVTDLFVKLHIHVILKALNMRLSGLKANYSFYINTQQYHCVTGAHVISVLFVRVPLVCNRTVTATDGVCMEKRGSLGVSVLLPSARDADEREKWIHALEGTILRHTLQLRV